MMELVCWSNLIHKIVLKYYYFPISMDTVFANTDSQYLAMYVYTLTAWSHFILEKVKILISSLFNGNSVVVKHKLRARQYLLWYTPKFVCPCIHFVQKGNINILDDFPIKMLYVSLRVFIASSAVDATTPWRQDPFYTEK